VPTPTEATYAPLQAAFHFFNAVLFGQLLPECLITLQRRRNAYGYFSGARFVALDSEARADEIAMNPQHFTTSTPSDICATLCMKWHTSGRSISDTGTVPVITIWSGPRKCDRSGFVRPPRVNQAENRSGIACHIISLTAVLSISRSGASKQQDRRCGGATRRSPSRKRVPSQSGLNSFARHAVTVRSARGA